MVRCLLPLLLLGSPARAAGLCALERDADAPFEEVRLVAEGVSLVIEVWVEREDDIPWARGLLDAVAATGHGAVLVVPLRDEPPPAVLELVDSLEGSPHEVALALTRSQVPRDALVRPASMKRLVKRYESAVPVKVVIGPLGAKGPEAILGKVGFRTLIDTDAASTAQPRLAGHLEGQARINVVLPPGLYEDDACSAEPGVAGFSPATADRVARAILRSGASAKTTTPTVRLALHPSSTRDTDAEVLRRWIERVVMPAGIRLAPASAVRAQALVDFRKSAAKLAAERQRTLPGRLVTEDALRTAAAALAELEVLPRELPGELTPTETLLGLSLLLVEGSVEGTVRLRPLSGPAAAVPGNGGTGSEEVDREALVATTRQLLAALPPELPSSLPVGGKLLTMDRYLTALASAARGDDPVVARPVGHPDPHARGLGWGASE